jgi:lysyl-tRNA synthetase class 2
VETLRVENDIELAVEIDDIAFANRTGDDFHGKILNGAGGSRFRGAPYRSCRQMPAFRSVEIALSRQTLASFENARPVEQRPHLKARAAVAAAFRAWFAERDFVEVETPVLQVSPGNETHLHALASELVGPGGNRHQLYLRTSPEFACKKILAAGERRIFEFARVFRNRERGALHHPEFTMLEWYRANEDYETLMGDCGELLSVAARTAGATQFAFRGRSADPFAAPERLTVAEAFTRHAGIDLLATLGDGEGDRAALAAAAKAAGVEFGADDNWGDLFSRIMAERIEPHLGNGRATILCEYPITQAALARPKPGDPRVAERFELYVCGVELANAFGELTDAGEQRKRFDAAMSEKERIYGERYPIDGEFLVALQKMPQASGIALGFDRLVMLATGVQRIEQVLWSAVAEPS